MQELKANSTLQGGKYVIKRTLGQGGFGITYEGVQTGLGRRVAIKEFFMKDYCERDGQTSHVIVGSTSIHELVEKYREKFIREAQMIASFDGAPHIVQIYDIFEENETAYYVMRYVEGGSLSLLVKEQGPLPAARAISLIIQTGQALSYLHAHQTMHRDIKPANILLDRDADGKDSVILIDFGISKHYTYQGHATTTSPIAYSKGFAPLEQYNEGGVLEFSPTSDVYSLGATLYFLLTGQTPPEATLLIEDPLEQPANISNEIWQIITHAMEPSRKRRFQTVDEMMQTLVSLKYSETLLATEVKKPEIENEETIVSKAHKEVKIASNLGEETIALPPRNENVRPLDTIKPSSQSSIKTTSKPVVKRQSQSAYSHSDSNNSPSRSQYDESIMDVIRNGIIEIFRENPVGIVLSIITTIVLFIYFFDGNFSTLKIVFFIIGFCISLVAQVAFQISMDNAGQRGWGRLIPGILMGIISAYLLYLVQGIGTNEYYELFRSFGEAGTVPVISITGIDLVVSFVKGFKDL